MIDPSFKDYILDQLEEIENLRSKRMFGSFGLYSGDKFFGIVSGDVLYLKTNGETKKRYLEAGMGPFTPSKEQILKNYMEVPEEIIDNKEELVDWVEEAIEI